MTRERSDQKDMNGGGSGRNEFKRTRFERDEWKRVRSDTNQVKNDVAGHGAPDGDDDDHDGDMFVIMLMICWR